MIRRTSKTDIRHFASRLQTSRRSSLCRFTCNSHRVDRSNCQRANGRDDTIYLNPFSSRNHSAKQPLAQRKMYQVDGQSHIDTLAPIPKESPRTVWVRRRAQHAYLSAPKSSSMSQHRIETIRIGANHAEKRSRPSSRIAATTASADGSQRVIAVVPA